MRESDATRKQPRISVAVPFYYSWVVVGLSFLANLMAAGIRSAPTVLIHPLEAEFGWSRTAIASAASLNLLLYGLAAPAGGWLIDRIGPRRVILGSLAAIAAGVTGAVFVRELWQLIFLWGIVLGIATGVTPSLGASVASRWFVSRRGLALGVMTNANAAGQVIFLPLLMAVIVSSGWRSALMVMMAASVILIPAIFLWMRDNPAAIGLEPYGSVKGGVYRQRRGSSLFILPYVSEPSGLFVFAVLYGLDWFATGPATTAILAHSFGQERLGRLFGLVFVFHQLGGALAAVGGGWARMQFGDYQYAFLAGAVMGLMAAGLALTIRMTGPRAPAIALTTEFANA